MSPTSRKQESLSVTLAAESTGRSLHQMALAYGMTVGDLNVVYLRSDAAGWDPP